MRWSWRRRCQRLGVTAWRWSWSGRPQSLAFWIVERLVAAPGLTLIYVLPVVVAASSFGWGPSLAAAIAGALAFDFFFTQPYYQLTIDSPSDIWATGLLMATGAIVSTVAAGSRRRALAGAEAAAQAEALQALAHVIIGVPSELTVVRAAAETLARLFRAPAVVFVEREGVLSAAALTRGAAPSSADEEAARLALSSKLPTRGGAYPVAESGFDFWPVLSPPERRSVLGVAVAKERPSEPGRLMEIVGAYLAAALGRR